jgi:hypothetical protein
MFDTVKNQVSIREIPGDLAAKLPMGTKDIRQTYQWHDGCQWVGYQWTDPIFGAMGAKQNRVGKFFWFERSLPKFLHGENERVLSASEAVEGIEALATGALALYLPLFDTTIEEAMSTIKVARLDVCFQRKVPCPEEVFTRMASSLRTVKVVKHQWVLTPPVSLRATGVTFKQSMKELGRWYDKGIESGNERYQDVVRHEEQLRGDKARAVADWQEGRFQVNQERALFVMNRRYTELDQVETFDKVSFIKEHGTKGLAAIALLADPSSELAAKAALGHATFYRVRALADLAKKMIHTTKLSLPDNAWDCPMVL